MRYSSPRHLSDRPPRERGALIGQLLLIAVTVVIGGLLAMAFTRHGEPTETSSAIPPEATGAPPSQPPPTASIPAAKPAQGESTPSSPASGSSAVGGGNLIRNPGFETGLDGWQALDGASLELVNAAHEGQQAVSLVAGTGKDPGMTARKLTSCVLHRTYTATAWVRASQPGVTVELNLVEYSGGRRLSTDIAGHVLPGGAWQHIEVAHVAHKQGAELAVEVIAAGLPQQVELLVDAVDVRPGAKVDTFTPRTTG